MSNTEHGALAPADDNLVDAEEGEGEDDDTEQLRKHWTQALATEGKPTWVLPNPFKRYGWGRYDSEDWGPQPLTVFELTMCELSWTLRSKPDWQRKAADPEIRSKWRKEALEQQEGEEQALTEKMVDYVLVELEGYANIADSERGIERACFDGIWYTDKVFTTDLRERLKTAVKVLEDVPEDKKDWHPGSNNQVLDLFHPSLYCIVYDRTHAYFPRKHRVAENFVPVPSPVSNSPTYTSDKFCWLPSDFTVNDEGSVKLVSPYINNLDPYLHRSAYAVIEEVLGGFIPLFERVLGDSDREQGREPFSHTKRLQQPIDCIWGDDEKPEPDDEPPSDEDDEEFYEKFYASCPKTYPEAQEYTRQLEANFKPVSLRGRTIQCIIKLANIHLTPSRPNYEGGSWHVEGMANEQIVASGIYYYDEENITESELSFRVAVGEPVYHGQEDGLCMNALYGMEKGSDLVQDLGSVVTKEGRALSWPNLFQHCVSPFELADTEKPGHRKILAIFLVDPAKDPIVSATHVPPQQDGWTADAFQEACMDPQSLLGVLPQELRDLIKENFPPTIMTLKEAQAYRLELMKERTASVKEHDRDYVQSFNMCEH
ncbi:hypothetical protein R3P38DRAFT_3189817 [Favolaschia claudopus]|uniref:Uncharacterized protein n=1 Tax=Favolaschia claudopus TaxID=2862362 RepID=A0AAW0BQ47_9AGAR